MAVKPADLAARERSQLRLIWTVLGALFALFLLLLLGGVLLNAPMTVPQLTPARLTWAYNELPANASMALAERRLGPPAAALPATREHAQWLYANGALLVTIGPSGMVSGVAGPPGLLPGQERLAPGDSEEEARQALGSPETVIPPGGHVIWTYQPDNGAETAAGLILELTFDAETSTLLAKRLLGAE